MDSTLFNTDGSLNTTFGSTITAAGIFLKSTVHSSSDPGISVDPTTKELILTTSQISLNKTNVGLGNVENLDEAGQVQGAFTANTTITAGKITLSTESGSSGGTIDLDSANKQIIVKDGSGNTRVILGKLSSPPKK